MTSRKYSSEAENEPEKSDDIIGQLLGLPDKTINKLLSSADEAAKILGVNKWEYALVLVTPARLILAPRGLKMPLKTMQIHTSKANENGTTQTRNE